jgi:small subunit ribosomal protein S1
MNLDYEEELEETSAEKFEALLDEFVHEPPRRGKIVEGEILKIDEDCIFLDVGAKQDAIVPRGDLERLRESDLEEIEEGDRIHVSILRTPNRFTSKLLVSISRGLQAADWIRARRMLANKKAIEVRAVGVNKGGLVVRFGRLRGFIPNSQIPGIGHSASESQRMASKQEMVGTNLLVKALEVDRNQNQLVFSASKANSEQIRRILEQLEVGRTIKGTVTNIVDFGAFVDLGGVDGLIHISELAWHHVKHPSDVLQEGEEVEVRVLDVDVDRERIALSRKVLFPSPWESVEECYAVGDLAEVTVRRVKDFGAFAELPDGVQGLIHKSELGITGSASPKDILRPGEKAIVRIIEIESQKQQISFSLRQVSYDEQMAWMRERREESVDSESVDSA